MFLFISKLLPLFIYPLGVSCLLLSLALIAYWRKPWQKWTPRFISAALLIILLASNGWVSNWLVKSLEWQNLPPANIPKAEAIVILGGSIKGMSPPRPMIDVSEQGDRVIYGAQLYHEQKAPLIITSGGRIAWLGKGLQPEAVDMAQLLVMLGVPNEAIITEPDSLNTYENATNVRRILAAKNIKQILLVTSALHMPRSLKIFHKQGIKAIAAPTDFLVSQQDLLETTISKEAIALNILPDVDHLEKTTKAIKEYVGMAVYWLRGWL
ncbi:MAG: YdcF family protein [Cyanobacteria bacterium J083]|nr:MAG: YdcF family protein [Cyanobacteria bacterium J083]